MKTKYQHVHFRKCDGAGQAIRWRCDDNFAGGTMGTVCWYSPSRQYCFYPDGYCVFTEEWLRDVVTFLNQLNSLGAKENNRRGQA
jgi:hypothetical protein